MLAPFTPHPPLPCRARSHSCLHTWQLRRVDLGLDPTRCELCRQPYAVPDDAWAALQAAGGVDAAERQRVAAWQPGDAAVAAALAAAHQRFLLHMMLTLRQLAQELGELDGPARLRTQRDLRLAVLRRLRQLRDEAATMRAMLQHLGGSREQVEQVEQALGTAAGLLAQLQRVHARRQVVAAAGCALQVATFLWTCALWFARARVHLASAASPAALLRRLMLDAAVSIAYKAACTSPKAGWRALPSAALDHGRPLLALGGALAVRRCAPQPLSPLAAALVDAGALWAASDAARTPAILAAVCKPALRRARALRRLLASLL